MAEEIDYYDVLEIERTASADEIKAAYRKMALRYHPDRNPGNAEAVEKFKLCAEAYEVLSDAQKKEIYDRYGRAGLQGGAGGGFDNVGDIFGGFSSVFGDIFGDIFGGGGGGQTRARQGADVRCRVTIDLHEAAKGVKKEVHYRRREVCSACGGSGAKAGTQPTTCRYCGGAGRIQQSSGVFSIQRTCPKCGGRGVVITDPCPTCRGAGLTPKEVKCDVTIPPGVDSGMKLRIPGGGDHSSNGGAPGDCYVIIQIEKHPFFYREGQDLICQIPIGYAQAALGAEIEAPTLDGVEKIKIPAGTQNGDVLRLRGRGMPTPRRNTAGDLLIQFQIEVPKKVSPEHAAILRKLAEYEGDSVLTQRKTFGQTLRGFVRDFFPGDKSGKKDAKKEEQSDKGEKKA